MNLAVKQRRWKRLANRLDKQAKTSEANQCRSKLRHEDFLSVMFHADKMTALSGKLYTPYVCVNCGYAHVGHVPGDSVVWMFEGGISFKAVA